MSSAVASSVPPGFRHAVSGLILPDALSRERQVWTKDDWRFLNRAAKLFTAKGLSLHLRCEHPSCVGQPITRIAQPGGFLLRCNHADRVFTKAF